MLLSSLFAAIVGAPLVLGQGAFDKSHKMTYLKGTWSISDKNVPVGPTFVNPAENKFFFPTEYKNTTSRTYSFALFIYQHGTYEFLSNGSMALTPFAKDGRFQMADSCKESNGATPYNYTELMVTWSIDIDYGTAPVLNLHEANWEQPQNLTLAYKPSTDASYSAIDQLIVCIQSFVGPLGRAFARMDPNRNNVIASGL
ncbi:Chaperone for protein-folding within the ER, fungal [Rhizoctonia solani]|uniref:Protein ROT1 n=1 Tax=Rhizoctonia solani TaxID=456999 RepID=A0A8H7M352_9AGAM|nr:Chaperone for protein-folding within the ER, fungal [Rhizoctonia solani]